MRRNESAGKTKVDASRIEQVALRESNDEILRQMLDEERVASSQVDSDIFIRLLGYLKAHKKLAALAVALSFVEAFVMTAPGYLTGLAIDVVTGDGDRQYSWMDRKWSDLVIFLTDQGDSASIVVCFGLLVGVMWLVRWLLAVWSTFQVQTLGQKIVHDLRVAVYSHVLSMDQTYLQKNPVGRLVNRATFDVQALSELFSDAFAQGLRDVLFLLVLMGVMLRLDVVIALLLIAAFPVLVAIAFWFRNSSRPALRAMTAVQSRMNGWMAENLAGMRENHLYLRQETCRAEFRALTVAHQASVTEVIRVWAIVRPAMLITSALATSAVLWVGYHRVEAGLLSVGVLLTFLQYTTKIWVPVRNLAEKFNLIQTALASAERIFDVLDERPRLVDESSADDSLLVRRGEIEFRDVSFRYPGKSTDVLRNVSFTVAPGKMLAIVGDTGAGKSTIVQLLSRFYDINTGEIRVDGIDIRNLTVRNLRASIAFVPQDVVIFVGTLRDNITLGADIPEQRLAECIEAVRADRILRNFPAGLEHEIEESGRTLSVGERQLIAFARALVVSPPILVLDEATANVDSETESVIQEAMQQLTAGRTSVVIAHRLSTVRNADQILVLKDGEIVERGTHAELISLRGHYAQLHDLHMGTDR